MLSLTAGSNEAGHSNQPVQKRYFLIESLFQEYSRLSYQGVSPHGFWLLVLGKEYFLDFETYPWFKEAKVDQIFNVTLLHEHHLFWNELDVDLDVAALDDLDHFPLISKAT
ncbi:MAG: DUF2442 domain-containing protein [Verrucomicrobia bacterium]|nr:DUF2442 domain-containing protein [Verrucomicrobiota bacterium]